MAKDPSAKVRAVVVRGSFWGILPDGTRVHVQPGMGKESEVEVTETQLAAMAGVLVRAENAQAEIQRAATESMAPPTPTDEAIAPPAGSKGAVADVAKASADRRR